MAVLLPYDLDSHFRIDHGGVTAFFLACMVFVRAPRECYIGLNLRIDRDNDNVHGSKS